MLIVAHHDHIIAHGSQLFTIIIGIKIKGNRDVHRQHNLVFAAQDRKLTHELHIAVPRLFLYCFKININPIQIVFPGCTDQIVGERTPRVC